MMPKWLNSYDPQTSGGLLIAVPSAEAGGLVSALRAGGVPDAAFIGHVLPGPAEVIRVTV